MKTAAAKYSARWFQLRAIADAREARATERDYLAAGLVFTSRTDCYYVAKARRLSKRVIVERLGG